MIDRALAWTFIVGIAILPLLVRVKMVQFISPKFFGSLYDTGAYGEPYVYYKFIVLIALTVTAVTLLMVKMFAFGYTIRRSYINIPLLILVALTLIAGLRAEHLNISLFGIYDRREGLITLLCYFALFFTAANTTFRENISKYITSALCIVASVSLILILFDFYGRDLAKYPIIRSIIGLTSYPENLSYGILNSTLMNPNYISGFAGALTGFFLTGALMFENRKRIIYTLLSIISFTVLLASLSTSGFLSLIVIMPTIIILAILKKRSKKTLATSAVIFASCSIVFVILYSHNMSVYNETFGFFTGKAISLEEEITSRPDISNEFELSQMVSTTSSGRTYIWRKTIDLIKERPLLGHGHDTILYYFPQYDPGKIPFLTATGLVTKPHNMYLEVAFGSGLAALGTLITLLFIHFLKTVTILFKEKENVAFLAALLVFWCVFLLQWLFNDSLICTSLVFWILFGTAVSLNEEITLK